MAIRMDPFGRQCTGNPEPENKHKGIQHIGKETLQKVRIHRRCCLHYFDAIRLYIRSFDDGENTKKNEQDGTGYTELPLEVTECSKGSATEIRDHHEQGIADYHTGRQDYSRQYPSFDTRVNQQKKNGTHQHRQDQPEQYSVQNGIQHPAKL